MGAILWFLYCPQTQLYAADHPSSFEFFRVAYVAVCAAYLSTGIARLLEYVGAQTKE